MRVTLEHRLSSLMAGCITTVITALLHSGRFRQSPSNASLTNGL